MSGNLDLNRLFRKQFSIILTRILRLKANLVKAASSILLRERACYLFEWLRQLNMFVKATGRLHQKNKNNYNKERKKCLYLNEKKCMQSQSKLILRGLSAFLCATNSRK